jgi:hypothetical protein
MSTSCLAGAQIQIEQLSYPGTLLLNVENNVIQPQWPFHCINRGRGVTLHNVPDDDNTASLQNINFLLNFWVAA